MPTTMLCSQNASGNDSFERKVFGPDARVILPRPTNSLADLSDADCAGADGRGLPRHRNFLAQAWQPVIELANSEGKRLIEELPPPN
jgi:hypothetical protein